MDRIQERRFDTKADQTIFELKSFLIDLGQSTLWEEGTVQNHSMDARTQDIMRDILKIAQNAAIQVSWRLLVDLYGHDGAFLEGAQRGLSRPNRIST